jgi:DNA primase
MEKEIEHVIEKKQYKVFLFSLQEDEVELANPLFRDIFNDLINYYLQNEGFSLEQYLCIYSLNLHKRLLIF